MEKIKSILAWITSIFSIILGVFSTPFNISNILFLLAGLCIMPPVERIIIAKTNKYTKKMKWIIYITLILFAFGFAPTVDTEEVNNIGQEQIIEENYTIDYLTAESLEKELNNGIDINGKIVKFKVREYNRDSTAGYNAYAGEHLNFISSTDLNLNSNDEVVGKVTSFKKFLGSWIIHYDLITKEKVKEESDEQLKQDEDKIEEHTENKEESNEINTEEKVNQEVVTQKQEQKKQISTTPKQEEVKEEIPANPKQEETKQENSVPPTNNSKTVYRTPNGKRYHLDPDCGGENSRPTTLDDAKSAGLTPCQKCAQ